jgi:hypothetical protein
MEIERDDLLARAKIWDFLAEHCPLHPALNEVSSLALGGPAEGRVNGKLGQLGGASLLLASAAMAASRLAA